MYWGFPATDNSDEILNFYNKYFKADLKILKVSKKPNGQSSILVYFADGSGAQ